MTKCSLALPLHHNQPASVGLGGGGGGLGAPYHCKSLAVVSTTMSNLALEQFLKERNIKLVRTDVGDKYVTKHMKANGLNLGGEKSGHILFGDINYLLTLV